MSQTKIVTNKQARDILYWHDLTAKEQAEFDYLDTDDRREEASFVRYRNTVYDLGEFVAVDHSSFGGNSGNGAFHGWHGYHSDSYFSAVLVRYASDFDSVVMATALS